MKVIALAVFAAAVIAKFVYIVAKTVRIFVLKIDPPMAGFDSEPAVEVDARETPENEPEYEVSDEIEVGRSIS